MDIAVLIFAPPILAWLFLALLPGGGAFVTGLIVFVLIWLASAAAVYPIRPTSGPDDWYRGIEQIPLWASLATAALAIAGQGWRHWRLKQGKPTRYVAVALGIPAALGLLFLLIVIF